MSSTVSKASPRQKHVDLIECWDDRLSFRIPASAASLDGFSAWATSDAFPERIRASFIDGEIYIDMSPEELETHALVEAEIGRVLMNLNRRFKLGTFCPDGTLVQNDAVRLSTEPDGTFVTLDGRRTGRVRLVPREGHPGQYMQLTGTPDWVLEVISRSSIAKDTRQLREAYHRARIPEYWLVDARGKDILFEILLWQRKGYVAAPARAGWRRSPLFQHRFRLVREGNELGLWQYTLETRSV